MAISKVGVSAVLFVALLAGVQPSVQAQAARHDRRFDIGRRLRWVPRLLDARPVNRWQGTFEALRWGAAFSDWETTRHFVNETVCTESSPILGPKPSAARIYAESVPIEYAFSIADTFLQRRMRSAPRADRIAATGFTNGILGFAHGFFAYNNGACFGPGFALR